MNLPSFLWLWRIAAWSMGLSLLTYTLLTISGLGMLNRRLVKKPRPRWLRPFHYISGIVLVCLVLLLFAVGIIGTLGHYGNLGHSPHLIAGLSVLGLVLVSAWSATQINQQAWARSLHITINGILLLALTLVTWTGWQVVQKYLP